MVSKVQCVFCFENSTIGERVRKEEGVQIQKTKQTEPLTSELISLLYSKILIICN